MKTTYRKHCYSVNCKYICICGFKFYRKNNGWFTLSPFNTKSYQECMNEGIDEMKKLKRKCPKCKEICKPFIKE